MSPSSRPAESVDVEVVLDLHRHPHPVETITLGCPFCHQRLTVETERNAEQISEAFGHLSYRQRFEGHVPRWHGRALDKHPIDLWRYLELIHDLAPDLIVETGTANGASAHFFAESLDALGGERAVITIDVDDGATVNQFRLNAGRRPLHRRIHYLTGNSVDPEIVARVRAWTRQANTVLVSLDSCHYAEHVAAELDAYAPLADYLVVEDTNITFKPTQGHDGPRPAVERFLANHPEWEPDLERDQRFSCGFNPWGWLRRA